MEVVVNIFKISNEKILYIKDINFYINISNINKLACGEATWKYEDFLNLILEYYPNLYDSLKDYEAIYSKMKFREMNGVQDIQGGEFILCLHPSNACNLSCKYCLRNYSYISEEKLSFKIAKEAIDYLIYTYAPYATKYVVDLSGASEPLIAFELVQQIAEYCNQKQREIGKSIAVMFATNATGLSKEKLNYINNHLLVGVSLDGDKRRNDLTRVYKNGNGTYEEVIQVLNKLNNKTVGVAVTITPLNQEVDEIYDHIYNLPNVDAISMKFVRSYDSTEYDFNNFDIEYLLEHYKKLCDNIFCKLKIGNIEYLRVLLRGTDHFGGYISKSVLNGYMNYFRCDAGKNRISVDNNGNIYACSVLLGYEPFSMGNIYSGIDKEKCKKYFIPNIYQSEKCDSCWANYLCGGECYAVSYLKNKSFCEPYEKKCDLKKGLIQLSIYFVERIKKEYPEMYKLLTSYVLETFQYHYTDTAIWSVINFLKNKSFSPDYVEVTNFLNASEYGVRPSNVLKYLKSFSNEIKAYRIKNVQDFYLFKYPAIAILNKKDSLTCVYALILDVKNENILLRTIDQKKPQVINKKEFISEYSDHIFF